MTQAEIENELSSLREQLSQAQRHQEARKQKLGQLGMRSLMLGTIYLILGIVWLAANIYYQREAFAGGFSVLVFVSTPLIFLYELAKLEKN